MSKVLPRKAVYLFCDFLAKRARAAALTVSESAIKKKVEIPKAEPHIWNSMSFPDWPLHTRIPGVEWVTGSGNGPEFNYRRR